MLERKGASDGKDNKIRLPDFLQRGPLLCHPAIAIDVISRHVASDVDVQPDRRQVPLPLLAYPQQGTGLGVQEAKAQKVIRAGLWQNGQIGLCKITAMA